MFKIVFSFVFEIKEHTFYSKIMVNLKILNSINEFLIDPCGQRIQCNRLLDQIEIE